MDETMRVMVVDDEKIVRQSLFFWFEKAGYTVDTAASGFEALEKLETHPFDVMFVDIKMPGMDGITLLEKIKTEYPDTAVIIITAYGSIESAINAMKAGACDYLLKPFKPRYLSLVMQKIVQQRRLTSECNYLKDRLDKISRFDNIIGQSSAHDEDF
jgi:DNA-binding NtrC family response regulator